MTGLGHRTWAAGEVVTAANVQGYLQDQTVMVFASASARDADLTSPTEGMTAYLTGTNELTTYDGSTWVPTASLSSEPSSFRNLLYNGSMQVAQRGTSSTGIVSDWDYFTVDRWQVFASNIGTWTMTQESDAPTAAGVARSLKMLCTSADASPAAADLLTVGQVLEGYDVHRIRKGTSDALPVTLSFWAKSNTTGTYIVELYDEDNDRIVSAAYEIDSSGVWEHKTITFPADTTGTFFWNTGRSLAVNFYLAAGSDYTSGTLGTTWATLVYANTAVGQTNLAASVDNYWQITGVQLETGSVATPFEVVPYQVDLERCQRYYVEDDSLSLMMALHQYSSTSTRYLNIQLPRRLRTSSPTCTGTTSNGTATIYSTSAQAVCFQRNASTPGSSVQLTSYTIDAEL